MAKARRNEEYHRDWATLWFSVAAQATDADVKRTALVYADTHVVRLDATLATAPPATTLRDVDTPSCKCGDDDCPWQPTM